MELPGAEALAWIVRTYAELRAAHGDVIGDPDLVLPTSEFFPDHVTATAEGVETLLRRTMSYAPLGEGLAVGLEFIAPGEAAGGGSCSSGGCGSGGGGAAEVRSSVRPVEDVDAYILSMSVNDGNNPVRLTSSIARAVGALVLAEGGEEIDPLWSEDEARVEVAAAVCGLGLLVFNGSYIYGKGCGGAKVHSTTSMDVSEVAVALALFVRLHDVKPGTVRAHLATTQREVFDFAMAWVDGNERIVRNLRNAPELLVGGAFELEPPRGALGRFFAGLTGGSKKKDDPLAGNQAAAAMLANVPKARVRSEAEEKRLAATKALVEEALREAEA